MLNKITIIGVGLIGGSLAKALKKQKFVKEIVGFGKNKNKLELAKELNIIDSYHLDIEKAINQADIIILATPVNSFREVLTLIKPYLKNQIITDVGSTKQSVVNDVKDILGDVKFIPAHPIAGKEKTGCEYADEKLFSGKKLIITPLENSNLKDINLIEKMWSLTGAIIEKMNCKTHDNIFALTSHLPHILAFTLVGYMSNNKGSENYTGGGFKDFSRIASSNEKMWSDICQNNKNEIIKHIDNYQQELNKIKQLIQNDKKDDYQDYFKNAKDNRNSWLK